MKPWGLEAAGPTKCQNCKDRGSDSPHDCEIGCAYRPSDGVVRVELVCSRTDGVYPVEEVFKDQFSNEEFLRV